MPPPAQFVVQNASVCRGCRSEGIETSRDLQGKPEGIAKIAINAKICRFAATEHLTPSGFDPSFETMTS